MSQQAERVAALRAKLSRYALGTTTHNAIVQEIANIEEQMAGHTAEVMRQVEHFAAHGRRAGLAPGVQHFDFGP